MEGNPARPSLEKNASEGDLKEAPPVSTPEYWKERQAPPFSRSYIEFQVSVARALAKKLAVPLTEVVDDYTTVFHSYRASSRDKNINLDAMTNEELTNAIYDIENSHAKSESPVAYHYGNRYGCFSFHAHAGEEQKGRVDIHFSNAEFDEAGPLSKDLTSRRIHELKDMFTAIKSIHPDAQYVRGDSWLYNLPAYKRLFPESYVAHPEVDQSPDSLATGRTWGQFCDDRLELKKDLAEQFLKNIEALEEVTPSAVMSALPYQALVVTAPIDEFYKKYNAE